MNGNINNIWIQGATLIFSTFANTEFISSALSWISFAQGSFKNVKFMYTNITGVRFDNSFFDNV